MTLSPVLVVSLFVVAGAILLVSTAGLVLAIRDLLKHRRRRPQP
jgi:hypothetical protein